MKYRVRIEIDLDRDEVDDGVGVLSHITELLSRNVNPYEYAPSDLDFVQFGTVNFIPLKGGVPIHGETRRRGLFHRQVKEEA